MPKRLVRDWTDSASVDSLSWHAEVLFMRLIMKADDYGRFHSDPCMLRASLFPRRIANVREADISRWIAECEKAGLIVLYEAGSKSCLAITKFGQLVRSKTGSKFPEPPADIPNLTRDPPRARGAPHDVAHDALHGAPVDVGASPLPPQNWGDLKNGRKKTRKERNGETARTKAITYLDNNESPSGLDFNLIKELEASNGWRNMPEDRQEVLISHVIDKKGFMVNVR